MFLYPWIILLLICLSQFQSSLAEQLPNSQNQKPANPEFSILVQKLSAHLFKTIPLRRIIPITSNALQDTLNRVRGGLPDFGLESESLNDILNDNTPKIERILLDLKHAMHVLLMKFGTAEYLASRPVIIHNPLVDLCALLAKSRLPAIIVYFCAPPKRHKLEFTFHPNLLKFQTLSNKFEHEVSIFRLRLNRLRAYLDMQQRRPTPASVVAIQKPSWWRMQYKPAERVTPYTEFNGKRRLEILSRLSRSLDGSIVFWQGLKIWGDSFRDLLIELDIDYSFFVYADKPWLPKLQMEKEWFRKGELAEEVHWKHRIYCWNVKWSDKNKLIILEECELGLQLWKGIDSGIALTTSTITGSGSTPTLSLQPLNIKSSSSVVKINPTRTSSVRQDESYEGPYTSQQDRLLEEYINSEICNYLRKKCNLFRLLRKSKLKQQEGKKANNWNKEAWDGATDFVCGWANSSCISKTFTSSDTGEVRSVDLPY